MSTAGNFNISEALSVGQLRKSHGQELIPAGEALDLVVAVIALDTETELVARSELHQLRKNRFTGIHRGLLPQACRKRNSNPIQIDKFSFLT
jgi:hypothetical protein